jgi:hypothetical protein
MLSMARVSIFAAAAITLAAIHAPIANAAPPKKAAAARPAPARAAPHVAARPHVAPRVAAPRNFNRNVGARTVNRPMRQHAVNPAVRQNAIQRNVNRNTTINRSTVNRNTTINRGAKVDRSARVNRTAAERTFRPGPRAKTVTTHTRFRGLAATGSSRASIRGRNFSVWRGGGYRVRRGGGWRTFVALSTLGALAIGANSYYPYAYISAPADYCDGLTEDGCQLSWQNVETIEGDIIGQCVAYCPWQ